MKPTQFKIDWAIRGLSAIAVVVATPILALAQTWIISPSSAMNAEGDINVTETGGPGRVQYLFPASEFSGLPPSHRLLVSFNWRGDASQSVPIDWTFADEKVWMSTTERNNLTNVFDENHGRDKTLVHDGTISFSILASGPAEGPRDFGGGTRIQTPFYYDPSKGNLLIEEVAFVNSVPFPGPHIDFQSSADVRVVAGSPNSTSGDQFNVSAIAQFEFVPSSSPGDINRDGIVDAADYVVWRKNEGTQADYDEWRENYGRTAGSGAALPSAQPLSAIPEPSSCVLAILAQAAVFSRIRRRRHIDL
jgi:hypothetical protein